MNAYRKKLIEVGLLDAADGSHEVRNQRRPFGKVPDFGVTSVNYVFSKLRARAEVPR